MNHFEKMKSLYVESATMNKKAASEGNYKMANKHAKILSKMLKKFKDGEINKDILIGLLEHEYIGVSCLAAVDLLRLHYETEKAEAKLAIIEEMDETNMTIDEKLTVMAAQIQLKSWREKGFVT